MTATFTKGQAIAAAIRRRIDNYSDPRRKERTAALRAMGEGLSRTQASTDYVGPDDLRKIASEYESTDDIPGLVDGKIPLLWWTHAENFGDLLSPWLVGRVAQRSVTYAGDGTNYLAVGSIVEKSRRGSIIWGSGLFGSESKWGIRSATRYLAVRGPLTRSRLRNIGLPVPAVYGDPALLAPLYYWPNSSEEAEVGIVVRWSEERWRDVEPPPGVKIIDLASGDIEGVIREMLSCKRIMSSSLHGLVIADAYGIPNAWLDSDSGSGGSRPAGGEFKFYDYMASVNKVRHAQRFDVGRELLGVDYILETMRFDSQAIEFDHRALLDACPFVIRA